MFLQSDLSETFLDLILSSIFFHIQQGVEFRIVYFLLLSTTSAGTAHEVLYNIIVNITAFILILNIVWSIDAYRNLHHLRKGSLRHRRKTFLKFFVYILLILNQFLFIMN